MKTNFMRKTLSLALALVMVLLLIPVSPMQASAAPVTYTFDANDLEPFGEKTYSDFQEVPAGTNNYFTLVMASNSKTATCNHSFEDGAYVATQMLNLNGKPKKSGEKRGRFIRFTTQGAATVKVYWECAGAGRTVDIWDANYQSVATSTEEAVKKSIYVSTFTLTEAGTYNICGANGNNYFCRVDVTPAPTGDKMTGGSLTLDGKIGVNFYMDLTPETLADTTAKMVFTVGDVTTEKLVSSGVTTDKGTLFTYPVVARQMNDTIKAKVVRTDGTTSEEFSYSVRTYCEHKLADTTAADNLKALCKAMLNYGAAAQNHFKHNTENLANAGLETGVVTVLDAAVLETYKGEVSYNGDKATAPIKASYGTLALESDTVVRVYFTLAAGENFADYTFTVNGASVTPFKPEGGAMYVLNIENIAAQDLENMYTITVSKGGTEVLTMNYGAFSYAYSKLSKTETPEELKLLVSALYAYNQAANDFFPAA